MKKTALFAMTKWTIDTAHSRIEVKVQHLKLAHVTGKFKEYDASIHTKGNDFLTARIDFWMNPASIDTGDKTRDIHLKSSDFLDIDKFTVIHFCAVNYVMTERDGRYEMHGDLTMHGVTQTIKLDVDFAGVIKDPFGNDKAIFNIKSRIYRRDWGLNWNVGLESGGVLISEEVWIECHLELIKQL